MFGTFLSDFSNVWNPVFVFFVYFVVKNLFLLCASVSLYVPNPVPVMEKGFQEWVV